MRRALLEWFAPACQLGMTATPLREENRNTYGYFGAPVNTCNLRQGIEPLPRPVSRASRRDAR